MKTKRIISITAILVFILVYCYILLQGLFFMKPGDELGYTVLNLYFILPTVSILCSIGIGWSMNTVAKWALGIMMRGLVSLLPSFIFGNNDLIEFMGLCIVLFGIGIGEAIRYVKERNKVGRQM